MHTGLSLPLMLSVIALYLVMMFAYLFIALFRRRISLATRARWKLSVPWLYCVALLITVTAGVVGCSSSHPHVGQEEVIGLPAGFPVDEIPIVAGEVMESEGVYDAATQTWDFTVLASGENILPRAKKLLLDAGFILKSSNAASVNDGADIVMNFWSKKYIVNVGSSTDASAPQVHYSITNTAMIAPSTPSRIVFPHPSTASHPPSVPKSTI